MLDELAMLQRIVAHLGPWGTVRMLSFDNGEHLNSIELVLDTPLPAGDLLAADEVVERAELGDQDFLRGCGIEPL